MKRFVFFIAALAFLVSCSSKSSPVAPPGDTIYNITGGEALFKVELKEYPLVVDSIRFYGTGSEWFNTFVSCHYDIPFTFNRDNFLCAEFPIRSNIFLKNNDALDSIIQNELSLLHGVMFAAILDSLWLGNDLNPFTGIQIDKFYVSLDSDKLKVDLVVNIPTFRIDGVDSVRTIQRNDKINTIFNDSWFTFKIYKTVNN